MRKNEAAWIESRQRWQIKVQSDGERRTFTDSTPGKKGKIAAEKKADHWLEHHLVGEGTRCEVLLDRFVAHKKATTSEVNHRQIDYHVRLYIRPIIGKRKISRLTENDLQAVIDQAYAAGLARKTLTSIRATLFAFVKYCRKEKATALFPEDIEIPKGARKSEKHIAAPNDLKKLFTCEMTTFYGREVFDRCIHAYRFAVITGLRPGELLGLMWSDLSDDKLTVNRAINDAGQTTPGKNDNARRTLSLKGLAYQEIQEQRKMLAREGMFSPYIFPDTNAGYFQQKHFRDLWYRYCQHNGMTKLTPYELRHTYVSINDEMPDGLKKQALGHSANMDTEGVYGHRKAGDMDRIAEYSSDAIKKIISG